MYKNIAGPVAKVGRGAVKSILDRLANHENVTDFGANTPGAADRNGIGAAQVRTGAGLLLLNGTGVGMSGGVWTAPFTGGRKITLYSAGNDSAVTFTLVGTDKDGVAQTEAITGPSGTTVTSTKFYHTITSVSSSATVPQSVEIGFSDALLTVSIASQGSIAIVRPEAAAVVRFAFYGVTDDNYLGGRLLLHLITGSSHTITWADGTTPADTRVYFAGGTEPTVTVSSEDMFEFVNDGVLASGDQVWYCIEAKQDLKP
jgi:hypothetical protein